MNVLVTGATGFVGINTVKVLSDSYNVRAFVRSKEKARSLLKGAVDISLGNISDINSLKKAMKGMDCVVHIAGLIKSHNVNNLYKINAEGSRNVALAARKTGVENIVYLSSLAARGPDNSDKPVSHYGYSKLKGEYELLKYACDYDLKILRPPIIYGEYEKEFFKLFKFAKSGFLPVLKDKPFSFVYVGDLAYAIRGLLNFKLKKPKIYYISDGNTYLWQEVADTIFDILNKQSIRVKLNLSPVFANFIAYLTYFLKDKAPFTLDKINEIRAQGWTCGYEKLKNDLNFKPEYAIRDGFKKTLEWYEKNGWL